MLMPWPYLIWTCSMSVVASWVPGRKRTWPQSPGAGVPPLLSLAEVNTMGAGGGGGGVQVGREAKQRRSGHACRPREQLDGYALFQLFLAFFDSCSWLSREGFRAPGFVPALVNSC